MENKLSPSAYKDFIEAQWEFKPIRFSGRGKYGEYATLNDMVVATREALRKYGFFVAQPPAIWREGVQILKTDLFHTSGLFIPSELILAPEKRDAQSFGSYMTYMQRYGYRSVLGLSNTGCDDDDGEQAMSPSVSHLAVNKPVSKTEEKITPEQVVTLEHELTGHHKKAEEILNRLGKRRLEDITKDKYHNVLKHVQQYKLTLRDNSARNDHIITVE